MKAKTPSRYRHNGRFWYDTRGDRRRKVAWKTVKTYRARRKGGLVAAQKRRTRARKPSRRTATRPDGFAPSWTPPEWAEWLIIDWPGTVTPAVEEACRDQNIAVAPEGTSEAELKRIQSGVEATSRSSLSTSMSYTIVDKPVMRNIVVYGKQESSRQLEKSHRRYTGRSGYYKTKTGSGYRSRATGKFVDRSEVKRNRGRARRRAGTYYGVYEVPCYQFRHFRQRMAPDEISQLIDIALAARWALVEVAWFGKRKVKRKVKRKGKKKGRKR